MARWKPLPEELDPQVREFAGQLRRLVDRSGLSIAAVSDRTGYSKTSWERYLNGRLLAPKRAIIALAEATGTNPVHLTTMWELAERAWSRSEMRHDMTMEAIRITQARAALGDFTPPQGIDLGHRAPKTGSRAKADGADGRGFRGGAAAGVREAPPTPSVPRRPGPP
ncbi:helix-turn-helix domain-containing protein, partial [Streptomyces sp. SID8455]|nr:helix-turn-helix domain-containing protein [Streptomyces sp. SID8455]